MSEQNALQEAERVLHEYEQQTLDALQQIKESAAPPPLDGSIGRLTYMDAYQSQQAALHGQRRLELQLEQIRAALIRVKEGTYGLCVQCGTSILLARLEDMPETPFCTPCQGRVEQQGRG